VPLQESRVERSRDLEELIADWFEAFSRGDGAWIERHVSREDDVRLVGTDPGDWQEGHRVGDFLKKAVEDLGGTVKIVPGEVLGLRQGSVGWGVTRATLRLPGGKEIGFRWTAVFRQEDGEWKAVQIHGSIGVPDEELLGPTP
jgi:ketosteroid isomerase-like protein